MLGKIFGWAEYIGCPPNVIVGWATAHTLPPGGSRAFGHHDVYPVTCGSMIASQPRTERCNHAAGVSTTSGRDEFREPLEKQGQVEWAEYH